MTETHPKEAIIVPCLNASVANYPGLVASLQDRGIHLHGITLEWSYRDMPVEDLAQETQRQVDALGVSDDATLLGHSIGAVLAGMETARRKYGQLVVCSPSPIGALRRDLNSLPAASRPKAKAENTHRAVQQLASLDPNVIFGHPQVPRSKRWVFVGQHETAGETMKQQADEAAAILRTDVHEVAGAGHFIDDSSNYIRAVVKAAVELS